MNKPEKKNSQGKLKELNNKIVPVSKAQLNRAGTGDEEAKFFTKVRRKPVLFKKKILSKERRSRESRGSGSRKRRNQLEESFEENISNQSNPSNKQPEIITDEHSEFSTSNKISQVSRFSQASRPISVFSSGKNSTHSLKQKELKKTYL